MEIDFRFLLKKKSRHRVSVEMTGSNGGTNVYDVRKRENYSRIIEIIADTNKR